MGLVGRRSRTCPNRTLPECPGYLEALRRRGTYQTQCNRRKQPHRTARYVDCKFRLQRAVQDAAAADDVRAAVVCALLLAAALAGKHGVVAAAWIPAHRQHRAQRGPLARIERQQGPNLHERE